MYANVKNRALMLHSTSETLKGNPWGGEDKEEHSRLLCFETRDIKGKE